MTASIFVPLDALHIANATADVVEMHRPALVSAFSRLLADEHAVSAPAETAAELVDLLLTLGSSLTAVPWDSSGRLRDASEDGDFRDAVERAFREACRAELTTPAPDMIAGAWTDLLRAYLRWLADLR